MEDATNIWKAIIAAVGTAATYLWGGWDGVFAALVVLACMDYVTGWACLLYTSLCQSCWSESCH